MFSKHKPSGAAKAGLLMDGYMTKAELAAEWNCHERTIGRYEDEPDGLPVTRLAGKNYYSIADARAFMERRTRQPNPTRRTRKAA